MTDDDRRLFEDSLRKTIEQHSGEGLDAALDEFGWRDALVDDPELAVSSLFNLQGEANATSTALDDVLLAALGLDVEASTAVVLSPMGQVDTPGSGRGGRLTVRGVATRRIEMCDNVVVIAADGGAVVAVVVPRDVLSLRPIGGVDPHLHLVAVDGESALPSAGQPVSWGKAVAAGQVALGHELVGAATAMLQLAHDHAEQRVQFGRPIAAFQAVRHRLADALVVSEAADAAVTAAWHDPSPLAAALAKAIGGRAAHTVGKHAQQVLGGMGFTSEHALHRYVRRTMALEQLLGDSRLLTKQIGAEILRTRQVPSMLPL